MYFYRPNLSEYQGEYKSSFYRTSVEMKTVENDQKLPKNSFLCSLFDAKVEERLFKSIESASFLYTCVKKTLFKRLRVIVNRKHVFIRFITEKNRSAIAVDVDTVR